MLRTLFNQFHDEFVKLWSCIVGFKQINGLQFQKIVVNAAVSKQSPATPGEGRLAEFIAEVDTWYADLM